MSRHFGLESSRLRCGVALAVIAVGASLTPAPVQAQDGSAASDNAAPSTATSLDEIVVTARRRPEPVQSVPVSIIALSAEQLESRSVTNLRSLQRFVPNLTFAPSQNVGEAAGNAFIRGIGQEDFGIGAEPGVGFYLDGVYLGRTLGTLMNITDVDRVEVLRGPQGTLFGKNTIGGAISIASVLPRPSAERRASVILGNYDRVELRTVANEPLSRQVFARLSGAFIRRNGHVQRLAPSAPFNLLEQLNWRAVDLDPEGKETSLAGRFQVRWLAIDDDLTVDLSLDGSRIRGTQGATHVDVIVPELGFILPRLNDLIVRGLLPGPPITAELAPESLLESRATGRNFLRQRFWGGSAKVTRSFSADTLSLLLAYRELASHIGADADGLHFDITETDLRVAQKQWSGELQLTGSRGRFSYVAGLFLFHENSEVRPTNANLNNILFTCGCFYGHDNTPVFFADPRHLASGSYAPYAQGNLRLTDRLSASLGVRYTWEEKRIDGEAFRLDANLQPTDDLIATGSNRGTWNPFTYRVGLEYQFSPDVMAYASLARGYKSGGFNVRTNINLPNLGFDSYKPETALTYEVGLRSEWWRRRLRFNATLFHTDYSNIQLRQVVPGGASLIDNAAKAHIRGLEIELAAAPTPGLTMTVAYGHLDPRYLDVGTVPGLTVDTGFQRTPRHSFTLGADLAQAIPFGTLELHVDYSFRSKEQFQITPAVNDQDAYGLFDARLSLRTLGDGWAIALFGTNLADVRYRTAGRGTLLGQTGIAYSSVGLPRQIGVQVSRRF